MHLEERFKSIKSDLENIFEKKKLINEKKAENSFNIFSVSKTGANLENFHSDIIAELLNPQGNHKCKFLLLEKFKSFLERLMKKEIDFSINENTTVTTEKSFNDKHVGRIDIFIEDDRKNAIIIENKMNFADDQPNQLSRYFNFASKDYNVQAIIYLSLDGTQTAERNKDYNDILKDVAAFRNNKIGRDENEEEDVEKAIEDKAEVHPLKEDEDLINGWLKQCIIAIKNLEKEESKYFGAISFINEYIKLIKHLASDTMDIETNNELYELLNKTGNLFEEIHDFYSNIQTYRSYAFQEKIEQLEKKPFSKIKRWSKFHFHIYDFKWDSEVMEIVIFHLNRNDSFKIHFCLKNSNMNKKFLDLVENLTKDSKNIEYELNETEKHIDVFFKCESNQFEVADDLIYEFTEELFTYGSE